jgi:hypothetical protein
LGVGVSSLANWFSNVVFECHGVSGWR